MTSEQYLNQIGKDSLHIELCELFVFIFPLQMMEMLIHSNSVILEF